MPPFYPPVRGSTRTLKKALKIYNNRLYYKYVTDKIFNQTNPNYIDLWYDVPFYGKVDTNGLLVMPKTDLMTYSLEEGDVVTFSFFSKALQDYLFFLKRAAAQGKTHLRSLLNNLVIINSFKDANLIQKQTTENYTTIFNNELYRKGTRIENFNNYICELLGTIDLVDINYTLFSAFSSSDITLRSTGLCFEFANSSHDDDSKKNPYLQDEEFIKYINLSANFGFRINKNAPWMIIADIASKPMLVGHKVKRTDRIIDVPGYLIDEFIPNIETFFKNNYDRVSYKSFELFKQSIIDGYQKYIFNISYYYDHGTTIIETPKNYKTITGVGVVRQDQGKVFLKDYDPTLYDDYYFLQKYEKVISSESKKKIKNSNYLTFKYNFDKMLRLRKPINEILDAIENYYTPVRVYNPYNKMLAWRSSTKDLTSRTDYVNMQSKETPSPGKIVTEFMPDL